MSPASPGFEFSFLNDFFYYTPSLPPHWFCVLEAMFPSSSQSLSVCVQCVCSPFIHTQAAPLLIKGRRFVVRANTHRRPYTHPLVDLFPVSRGLTWVVVIVLLVVVGRCVAAAFAFIRGRCCRRRQRGSASTSSGSEPSGLGGLAEDAADQTASNPDSSSTTG